MSFSPDFFVGNRRQLIQTLEPDSAIVLTAHGNLQRSTDGAYRFEQEANFFYLSGIDDADWRLIIDCDSGHATLVAPTLQRIQQLFDPAITAEQAQQISGVDAVVDTKAGAALLQHITSTKRHIYGLEPPRRRLYGFYTNRARYDLWRQLPTAKRRDVRLTLAKQRAIKQPIEIATVQKAIDVTVVALQKLAQTLPQLSYEYEAEALLSYEFRRQGLHHGYDPIVASGPGACVLHYDHNQARLQKDQLLLIDVGAVVDHYPADMTRTFAIDPPTDRQMQVYEAVQRVHDFALALHTPGQPVRAYLEQVDQAMGEELIQLGLIKKISWDTVRQYFPHAIGHGLGLDVHDALGRPEVFAENMVITVEPGIYIPEEGIGVRLENDILITADGPRNLSSALNDRQILPAR